MKNLRYVAFSLVVLTGAVGQRVEAMDATQAARWAAIAAREEARNAAILKAVEAKQADRVVKEKENTAAVEDTVGVGDLFSTHEKAAAMEAVRSQNIDYMRSRVKDDSLSLLRQRETALTALIDRNKKDRPGQSYDEPTKAMFFEMQSQEIAKNEAYLEAIKSLIAEKEAASEAAERSKNIDYMRSEAKDDSLSLLLHRESMLTAIINGHKKDRPDQSYNEERKALFLKIQSREIAKNEAYLEAIRSLIAEKTAASEAAVARKSTIDNKAATKIQRIFRGRLGRSRAHSEKLRKHVKSESNVKKHHAGTADTTKSSEDPIVELELREAVGDHTMKPARIAMSPRKRMQERANVGSRASLAAHTAAMQNHPTPGMSSEQVAEAAKAAARAARKAAEEQFDEENPASSE